MKLIRAAHLGMCFGVRDAVTLAQTEAAAGPVTVLGDLVHNPDVLGDLSRRGVRIEKNLDSVRTETVLITAHGASETRLRAVAQRGHRIVDAACPLVRVAHRALSGLVRDGFFPVIIGRRDHVEVRGMTEDLADFAVVLDPSDVQALPDREKFGVVAQTTQPIDVARDRVERIRRFRPRAEVRFIDTVCQPTKQRQSAAADLARASSIVIVIGGRGSNNTRELARTCQLFCSRVHQIENASEIDRGWFESEDVVGVTAGTSTPDWVIAAVEEQLRRIAEDHSTASESRSARRETVAG
jgi:4-hydroxy-3-methylbut-2-enyl diphosphate reductase